MSLPSNLDRLSLCAPPASHPLPLSTQDSCSLKQTGWHFLGTGRLQPIQVSLHFVGSNTYRLDVGYARLHTSSPVRANAAHKEHPHRPYSSLRGET